MLFEPGQLQFSSPKGFLVIDGVNGAGKGTLIRRISDYLEEKKLQYLLTRQPGGTYVGKEIRRLLLENTAEKLTPLSEILLFSADRSQHVERVIRPSLGDGKLVVCDRYYYSTVAFQGYGRGYDLDQIHSITKLAVGDMKPDLLVLLDLDPEIGLARTRKRDSDERDNFEAEEIDFHRRLRKGFLELAEECEEPVVVVDASPSPEEVWEKVKDIVDRWLGALDV